MENSQINARSVGVVAIIIKNRSESAERVNKICTGHEAAECIGCLKRRLKQIDREIVVDRGDFS